MRCPFCDQNSRVLETRAGDDSVWRRHRCELGHDFSTTQTVENRNLLLERRNRQIIEQVLAGKSMNVVATAFGLKSHSEVSRIVKAVYPNFNARRAGQLAAWRPGGRKRESRPKAARDS